MVIKLSISLDKELADLIKKEAQKTGRTISEIFADAVRAYQKEKRRQAYTRFAASSMTKELKAFENVQLESIKKRGKDNSTR